MKAFYKKYIANFKLKKEFKELIYYLKQKENMRIKIYGSLKNRVIEIISLDRKTEVRLKFIGNDLIIQKVFLQKQNQGTGTYIFRWLIDYANKRRLEKVIAHHPMTPISVKLCKKFNFKMDKKRGGFMIDGIFSGDYYLELAQ